ncbi:2072_t:CDS:2, partial [Dentiscutata heterogama]
DDYLIENPVYFWNNLQNEVPEMAIFATRIMFIPPILAKTQEKNCSNHIQNKNINNFKQIVQINTPNSNEICYDKIISNIEFNDIDNINNNLKQFEEEDVIQMIANINNFNTNDQIIYNEVIIESSIQATYNNHEATLEN